MLEFFSNLFSSKFMPHGHCYFWLPEILWLHVGSDLLIALAYYSIPVALFVFVKRRRDLQFRWIFHFFALFILACGTTHVMNIWTVWDPIYRVEGLVKLITALVSVLTALVLWPLIPRALALPSPSELRKLNEDLERIVSTRTSDLEQTNSLLQETIKKLENSENRFHQAFDAAPGGMLIVNASGRIEFANRELLRLFGYTKEELVGHEVEVLVPDSSSAQHPNYRSHFMQNPAVRQMGSGRDLYGKRKDGSLVSVEIGLTPLQYGNAHFVIAAVLDISQRKRAELELKRHTNALAASNSELQRFAHIASHDLREPLRTISGFTELFGRRYASIVDEDGRQFIQFITEGVDRMNALLSGLLEYSRVESLGGERESVDSKNVLKEAIENLRSACEESGAQIIMDEEFPTLQVNKVQLLQLFQNVIGNAIKFRRSGTAPLITIKVSLDSNQWCFSVEDNGIGINLEDRAAVFELFKRGHASNEYPGTGIGLTLCKKIVERHGGQIWIEASSGGGTLVKFTLPRIMEAETQASMEQPSA